MINLKLDNMEKILNDNITEIKKENGKLYEIINNNNKAIDELKNANLKKKNYDSEVKGRRR